MYKKAKHVIGLMMVVVALPLQGEEVAQWEPVKLQTSKSQSELSGQGQGDYIQVEMLGQIERLQREIQELRGLLEEKSYEIDRMKRDQRERYLDLDRRISQLSGGSSSVTAGSSSQSSLGAAESGLSAAGSVSGAVNSGTSVDLNQTNPSSSTSNTTNTSLAVGSNNTASGDEREDYLQAFGFIRAKQYPEAVEALKAFIGKYPNGEYAGNAHYWLGEVYIVLPDLEQAKQAFMLVLNRYPDHRKAPDAAYKLGVVYDQLGQSDEARRYLNKVLNEKPSSVAARLAENYLRSLK